VIAHRLLPALVAASIIVAACSDAADSAESSSTTLGAASDVTLTLLTYDSFVAPESLQSFTDDTGIVVEIATGGDAGTLVNKAILTAGNPEGDVLWGIDNTLLSRALDAGVFVPYEAADLGAISGQTRDLVPGHEVTPVDTGDVCINIDPGWFESAGLDAPRTLDDLTRPDLAGLLVAPNPATSSPGLAFLLATIAAFGDDGFEQYWQELRDNDLLVVDSWDAAYFDEFTAGGGAGEHPIVVSYASSPPATIVFAEDPKPTEPTTASLDQTCFRQVEFAGILEGTEHVDEAQRLVDFLISEQFQAELPLTNFVFPVREGVELPEVFTKFASQPTEPWALDPSEIAAHREDWVERWTNVVLG
jgi:thiamine transport system substrate-binding protein